MRTQSTCMSTSLLMRGRALAPEAEDFEMDSLGLDADASVLGTVAQPDKE